MKRRTLALLAAVVLMLLVSGCAPGSGHATAEDPAGFFFGVWHGWIAPFSLIVGAFDADIRIYEIHNTGWWYDLGYYVAVISGFGGLSLFRRRRRAPHPKHDD